jgi:hypothetical protein
MLHQICLEIATSASRRILNLSEQQDQTSKLIEFYNRLKSMSEWNDAMAIFMKSSKQYDKMISHESASGALLAAATILEEDYIKEED